MSAALASRVIERTNGGRVPPEFIGQARALRTKLMDEHNRWQPYMSAVLQQARPRPGFRRVKAQRLAEVWRALPGAGARLDIATSARPGHLRIAELRILPSRLRIDTWPPQADELAITLASVTLGMEGDAFLCDHRLLADIGLHALARRFERGADRSESAVLADLTLIAEAYEGAVMQGGSFNVAGWRGDVRSVAGASEPVLCVRTFLPDTNQGMQS